MILTIEVAAGELIDKLTILDIKLDRIKDPAQRTNVAREREVLATAVRSLAPSPEVEALITALRDVNQILWDIEDDIRECERRRDFGETFVGLARAVYKTNDRRAALKRGINDATGSRLVEEKSYSAY